MDEELHNPLDDLISFPEYLVYSRQDIMPSESSGWGLYLLIDLPRLMVQANLDAQLTTAGFVREAGAAQQPGLLRFIREDAYVWGMVSHDTGSRTSVLVSYTSGREDERQSTNS